MMYIMKALIVIQIINGLNKTRIKAERFLTYTP